MRLLTVALFSVILYHCYADIKIPVNRGDEPKTITSTKSRCKDRDLNVGREHNQTFGGSYCNVDANNFGIMGKEVGVTTVGFCANRLMKCTYDSKNFCSGNTQWINNELQHKLEANEVVFTDSNLCQLEIHNEHKKAVLVSRYKQDCFGEFTGNPQDQGDKLHVKTVANYRPWERDVTLASDKMVMGDSFDFEPEKSASCGASCGYGSHMTFSVDKNALFSLEIHPKQDCAWIALCLDYKNECKEKNRIMMLLDQNILLPHTMNSAIVMNLRDAKTISIERTNTTTTTAKFITITTDTHERVVLDAVASGHFALMMSDVNCLEAPIYSTLGDVQVALTKVPTRPEKKLRWNPKTAGKVEEAKITIEKQESGKGKSRNTMGTNDAVTEFVEPSEETESVMNGTAGAVTAEVTYAPPDLGSLKQINTDNGDTSTKARNSGWLTWGYFYGALAGSTLGLVIIGVIFFFARRSIYGDWYRGMYKRYGCDASGTTGGVTGADFGATTGGNTTIGATTAGATATSATTGGDTTSNSAMSGTSGATSGEKTGGSTMITM